jgi:cytidine deaminase
MLPSLPTPELFFGLCSPVGTDNKKVADLINDRLRRYSYDTKYLKVTDLMKSIVIKDMTLSNSDIQGRYDTHIKYANKIRELFNLPYVLSVLCCAAVRNFRSEKGAETYIEKQAYVFDQFKRTEEVALLRQVYGRLFIVISIYSDREKRIESLTQRIAHDHVEPRPDGSHKAAARSLVDRDEREEGDPNGQRLQETFAVADLFINMDDPKGAEALIDRFFEGLFGANFVSPTREEYGMYMARNAALRSLDLSRQVGAAIMTSNGETITAGCNEVPKAGGGTYWTGDTNDSRDYAKRFDSNEQIKRSLLSNFTRQLAETGYLRSDISKDDVNAIILKETSKDGRLRNVHLMDLLEFGRIIHAEMSALCDAARLGRAVKDAILYCTTFPCHICAKHIVAAGIKKVVFIEPYPKSYAEQLHGDAIVVGQAETGSKVVFEPFIGIAPFRYRDIFERGRRKDDQGDFIEWIDGPPQHQPNVRYTVATYLENEIAVTTFLSEKSGSLVSEGRIQISN